MNDSAIELLVIVHGGRGVKNETVRENVALDETVTVSPIVVVSVTNTIPDSDGPVQVDDVVVIVDELSNGDVVDVVAVEFVVINDEDVVEELEAVEEDVVEEVVEEFEVVEKEVVEEFGAIDELEVIVLVHSLGQSSRQSDGQ